MTDVFFIAGNQLFSPSLLANHRGATILMVESEAHCRRLPFHQQKLGFLLAAMREHARSLADAGFRVRYFQLQDRVSVEDAVTRTVEQTGACRFLHFDSEDRGYIKLIARRVKSLGLRREVIRNPMFLLDNTVIDGHFDGGRPRMATFYRAQRQRMALLMEGNRPLGGKWSFDGQNRAALPRDHPVPELPAIHHSRSTRDCLAMVGEEFPDHAGRAEELWLPTDRQGAVGWLDRFLEERLVGFGTYEDAISLRSPTLFHSVLSPFLNVGLLTPDEVVSRALEASDALGTPLNDLEGFLRQIVGWREFIRGVYRRHRNAMRKRNVSAAGRRLTGSWLTGETGIVPLDQAIGTTIKFGWNHHIERLMVIANLMNLAEIHPSEAYRFFMSYYVDAYDWVMVPNLHGMGLTSDGGIFSTKPYICGSNYIRKMSDYPTGEWTDVMDGLYWRFVARHREVLATNPRLAMMVHSLDRIDRNRLVHILGRAEAFLDSHTESGPP